MEAPAERKQFTEPMQTNLTQAERLAVIQLSDSNGYAVLMKLMEAECIMQDAKLTQTPNHEHAKVISEHAIAQAYWEFLSKIKSQIQHERAELVGQNKKPSVETPEQQFINETLLPKSQ